MFPQLKKINNESGIILFIVLMTAIIIMMLSVGVLTQSMNEINYAQQQIDQIVSDQLSKGVFWNAYANTYMEQVNPSVVSNFLLEGRNYQVNLDYLGTTASGDTIWNSVANYDTFQ